MKCGKSSQSFNLAIFEYGCSEFGYCMVRYYSEPISLYGTSHRLQVDGGNYTPWAHELLQDSRLSVAHVLETNIFELVAVSIWIAVAHVHSLAHRFECFVYGPDLAIQEPRYKPSAFLDFIMCGHPVLGLQYPLRQDSVPCPQVQLLSGGYRDVMQSVEESKRLQRGVGCRNRVERGIGYAMRCVYDALGSFWGHGCGDVFCPMPVYGQRGALSGGCRGKQRMGGEGDDEGGMVVEGIAGCGQAGDAEPGRERSQRVVVPVGVVVEGGRRQDGSKVLPRGNEPRGLLEPGLAFRAHAAPARGQVPRSPAPARLDAPRAASPGGNGR